MPRRPRDIVAGEIYHVINRGNDRRVIFSQDADYEHFLDLLDRGFERADVSILGFCAMPTHFHLLVRPETNDALSTYMHWVTGRYACDLRAKNQTTGNGHVFQRRYWSKEVASESQFLTVLRYIEANALRSELVMRAEDWRWGSLADREGGCPRLICPAPVAIPKEWAALVNLPQEEFRLRLIRRSANLARPL